MRTEKMNGDYSQQVYSEEKFEPLDRKEILFFTLSFGFIVLSILIGIYLIVDLLLSKVF